MTSERQIAANRRNASVPPSRGRLPGVVAGSGLRIVEVDGDLPAEPEQPPERAHLATIGFALQSGSNAAAAQPSVAVDKDARG